MSPGLKGNVVGDLNKAVRICIRDCTKALTFKVDMSCELLRGLEFTELIDPALFNASKVLAHSIVAFEWSSNIEHHVVWRVGGCRVVWGYRVYTVRVCGNVAIM